MSNTITGERITVKGNSPDPNPIQIFIENTGENALGDVDIYVEFQPQIGNYIDYVMVGSNYPNPPHSLEVEKANQLLRKIHIQRFAKHEIITIEAAFYTGIKARVYTKIGNFVRNGKEAAPCKLSGITRIDSNIPYLEANGVRIDLDAYVKEHGLVPPG